MTQPTEAEIEEAKKVLLEIVTETQKIPTEHGQFLVTMDLFAKALHRSADRARREGRKQGVMKTVPPNLSGRILKEVSDTVKGCLGEEEHALTVNDYDKGFCHGFNLYHSQITKRLKDAGVLID